MVAETPWLAEAWRSELSFHLGHVPVNPIPADQIRQWNHALLNMLELSIRIGLPAFGTYVQKSLPVQSKKAHYFTSCYLYRKRALSLPRSHTRNRTLYAQASYIPEMPFAQTSIACLHKKNFGSKYPLCLLCTHVLPTSRASKKPTCT